MITIDYDSGLGLLHIFVKTVFDPMGVRQRLIKSTIFNQEIYILQKVLKCVFVFQMTTTSAHIWQSSETYRWNTGDVLGRGATAVVYKARNLVCY